MHEKCSTLSVKCLEEDEIFHLFIAHKTYEKILKNEIVIIDCSGAANMMTRT